MNERDAGLQRVASRMLRRRVGSGTPRGDGPLWSAEHFGLQRVAVYAQAPLSQQRAILDSCASGVLSESLFVERCGIEFCARMTLAADSSAERQVYAMIGADEASHSAWLQPWLNVDHAEMDAFNAFLADCVAISTPQALAYLMQVVLEGIGIVHYAGLASACNDAELASTFKRMSEDEALHHAAGLAAFSAGRLTHGERRFLRDASYVFLQMMRSGPQAVFAALDRGLGGIGRADAAAIFASLDAGAGAAAKLDRMRRMMAQPGMEWLVDELASRGAFEPCTPTECAQISQGVAATAA